MRLGKGAYETGTVDNVIGLDFIEFLLDVLDVLETGVSGNDGVALLLQELDDLTTDPTVLTENKEFDVRLQRHEPAWLGGRWKYHS